MGSRFSSWKTVGPRWGQMSWSLWRSFMLVPTGWIVSTGLTLRSWPRHLELSGWATSGPSLCLTAFIWSSPRCSPTISEGFWGPSSAPYSLLSFPGGRLWRVLSLQRRSSLLEERWAPLVFYKRWISPKHKIPWIGVSSRTSSSVMDF